MSISVIVPVYNEQPNVALLYLQLMKVFRTIGHKYEFLFVDDGSCDGTYDELRALADMDHHVRVVRLRRNYGQTAALQAGFDHARGDVWVTLDGDLQNDPADIPRMLEKLEEGFDLVHGWRKVRQDGWLLRLLPSRVANWLISHVTKFPVHDLGCTLKVMRREIAQELQLVGEMHRFIPILAHQRGARCAEIVTQHHARLFGKSKYGLGRTPRVLLDLITVKFLSDYIASPMKCFGQIGLAFGAMGLLSLVAACVMKLWGRVDLTGNPLLLLSVVASMVGIHFVSLGLLGEVNARIYFNDRRKSYTVARRIRCRRVQRSRQDGQFRQNAVSRAA